ncbi:hypothetical protein AURDEDRAFT_113070, partial [Auricularia subglabra TFB-10046 SS5]
MTRLVNRTQTAILDSLGSPAQSNDVRELSPLIRINYAKIDALDAKFSAADRVTQTRFDALERQVGDLSSLLHLLISRVPSPSQQSSPVMTSTRKRPRSRSGDSQSPDLRLARRRALSPSDDFAVPESCDHPSSQRAARTLMSSSSLVAQEIMPGSFAPPRIRPPGLSA